MTSDRGLARGEEGGSTGMAESVLSSGHAGLRQVRVLDLEFFSLSPCGDFEYLSFRHCALADCFYQLHDISLIWISIIVFFDITDSCITERAERKHARVSIIRNADPNVMRYYRLISELLVLPKVLEKTLHRYTPTDTLL